MMKEKLKQASLKLASKVILNTAQKEVNAACFFLAYQPKLPEDAKKLRKF